MDNSVNLGVWFEIPASNFLRAVSFYQTILDIEIVEFEMNGLQQGLLPHDDKSLVSGSIVCGQGFTPSQEGTLLYLNGGEDLNVSLSKVESCGGSVLLPKTHLGEEIGYIAHFVDTEGNRVGIHSMQ